MDRVLLTVSTVRTTAGAVPPGVNVATNCVCGARDQSLTTTTSKAAAASPAMEPPIRQRRTWRRSVTTLLATAWDGSASRRARMPANESTCGTAAGSASASGCSWRSHSATAARKSPSDAIRASAARRSLASSVPSTYSPARASLSSTLIATEAFLQHCQTASQNRLHGRHWFRKATGEFIAAPAVTIGQNQHAPPVRLELPQTTGQARICQRVATCHRRGEALKQLGIESFRRGRHFLGAAARHVDRGV